MELWNQITQVQAIMNNKKYYKKAIFHKTAKKCVTTKKVFHWSQLTTAKGVPVLLDIVPTDQRYPNTTSQNIKYPKVKPVKIIGNKIIQKV